MSEVINIKELNERIERESVFVDTLRAEMSTVIVGQTHLIDTLVLPRRWRLRRSQRPSTPISPASSSRPTCCRPT